MKYALEKYLNLDDLFNDRNYFISNCQRMLADYAEIEKQTEKYNHLYLPVEIKRKIESGLTNENFIEKKIDRFFWNLLIDKFKLENFMLCTDYEKLRDSINTKNEFPKFTKENAEGWILSLKELIYINIKKMFLEVYSRITNETYRTGGWNSPKKKRNNAGIDTHFIITTNDYNYMFEYWRSTTTITDDLEKIAYLIKGESLPEISLKQHCVKNKITEYDNGSFRVKFCQNGNTHYYLSDDLREALNKTQTGQMKIGEHIKIKIFA